MADDRTDASHQTPIEPSRLKTVRKLNKHRLHVVKCDCGCQVEIIGHPSDGKSAVLITAPPGSTIASETLTPPPVSV